MSYPITFSSYFGYDSSKTYYAQFLSLFSGKFWNGTSMVSSPTYTNTAISASDLGSTGVYGVSVPSGLPRKRAYKVLVRDQSGGSPANTDRIIHEEKIKVLSDGKVRPINMDVVNG